MRADGGGVAVPGGTRLQFKRISVSQPEKLVLVRDGGAPITVPMSFMRHFPAQEDTPPDEIAPLVLTPVDELIAQA